MIKTLQPMTFKRLAATLIGTAMAWTVNTVHAATVDVLIVYDTYTQNYFRNGQDAAIRSWVNQVNTMYKNSNVDVQLRLVGTLKRDIPGTTMQQVLPRLRTDSVVAQRRTQLGADYVSMLSRTGNCGLGYVAVHKSYVHSVVGPKCGPMTLAHELGHTMGLTHSRRQGDTRGYLYDYALGHGSDGNFGTLMAYAHLFGAPRVGKFSNPDITCPGNLPCGIAEGEQNAADSAKAINNVRNTIAGFFPTRIWSGLPVTTSTDTGAPVSLVNNAVYTFRSQASSRCLTILKNSTAENAPAGQWNCTNANNQRFVALASGDGYYRLRAKHSGRCLVVGGFGSAENAVLRQVTCNTAASRMWRLIKNEDGSVALTYRPSNKVVDLRAPLTTNGTLAVQMSAANKASQRWTINRLQ